MTFEMKKCDACGRELKYIGYFKIPKDCKYVKDLGIKIPFGVRNVKICMDCVKKFNDRKG